MFEPKNVMWTEKYRPTTIDEMVGDFKHKIKKYLENPSAMQHLLLHSLTPGTGKSTLSRVIIKSLNADALILNASEDRKIETIREKVNEFVKTKSSKPGVRRIVFMDEGDGLTSSAQDALRNLMETYASNALFIITCNHIKKIIDPIKSRCVVIEFSKPEKQEMFDYLKKICFKENVEYTDEGIYSLIDKNYPSIRNCVQALQSIHTEGKTLIKENAKHSDDEYETLWNIVIVEKDWKKVRDYVLTNEVDYRVLNKFFWAKAVTQGIIRIIQVTCSNEDKMAHADAQIIFVTSLIEMTK